jgi:6-phosphogluconate dehydrogenase
MSSSKVHSNRTSSTILLNQGKIMKIGVIGLGKMGANIVRRLIRSGHECVVFNRTPEKVQQLATEGAIAAIDLADMISKLPSPRVIWLMLPAGEPTEKAISQLAELLAPSDIIIDGGNTHYIDNIRRAKELAFKEIDYVDVGTSGGVWGLERGYCLMIGGQESIVQYLDPIFKALAPGRGEIPRTPGRESATSTAEEGYLHCGNHGAGHFVKGLHNGVEYGLMAAYAEGLNILRRANIGQPGNPNAETTTLANPEYYQYDLNLAEISELWRRGSVISSWLLDLIAISLLEEPNLDKFADRVSDSGEGRWTIAAAIDQGTPAPVLSAALYSRFSSRGNDEFASKVLSAMRYQFGGHQEQQ